jgi:hypothetical protein
MMYPPVFLISTLLVADEVPSKDRVITGYYEDTEHPGAAGFYRRIADERMNEQGTSKERTMADFYQRTGHPGAAQFCGQVGKGRAKRAADLWQRTLLRPDLRFGGATSADKQVQLPRKGLTPAEVYRNRVQGFAAVEIAVAGVYRDPGNLQEKAVYLSLQIDDQAEGDDQLHRPVSIRVFDRLRELGIEDPVKHFVGKKVCLNGVLQRTKHGEGFTYSLQIDSLDQIESVTKN